MASRGKRTLNSQEILKILVVPLAVAVGGGLLVLLAEYSFFQKTPPEPSPASPQDLTLVCSVWGENIEIGDWNCYTPNPQPLEREIQDLLSQPDFPEFDEEQLLLNYSPRERDGAAFGILLENGSRPGTNSLEPFLNRQKTSPSPLNAPPSSSLDLSKAFRQGGSKKGMVSALVDPETFPRQAELAGQLPTLTIAYPGSFPVTTGLDPLAHSQVVLLPQALQDPPKGPSLDPVILNGGDGKTPPNGTTAAKSVPEKHSVLPLLLLLFYLVGRKVIKASS